MPSSVVRWSFHRPPRAWRGSKGPTRAHSSSLSSCRRIRAPPRAAPRPGILHRLDRAGFVHHGIRGETSGRGSVRQGLATSLTLAVFIASGVPLRGAVGYGDTCISSDPIFFTGKALHEAMKAERCQVWAGAALTESAVNAIGDQRPGSVVEYAVPWKQSAAWRPQLAVDWVSCLGGEQSIDPPWQSMFAQSEQDIQLKMQNTKEFFNRVRSSSRPASWFVDPDTIKGLRKQFEQLGKGAACRKFNPSGA